LIRFLVSDRDNLSWWVEKTGDCVSNMNVLTELTASASDPLLAVRIPMPYSSTS
jgi:hypothetical protein